MTGDDIGPADSASGESSPSALPTTAVDADAAFDLLADSERRTILTWLRESDDGTATTGELIDRICGRHEGDEKCRGEEDRDQRCGEEDGDERPGEEDGERKDDGDAVARDRVALRVHHKHLPMLADAGVVERDRRSETVRYRGSSFLEALLDAERTDEAARATGEARAAEAASDAETE